MRTRLRRFLLVRALLVSTLLGGLAVFGVSWLAEPVQAAPLVVAAPPIAVPDRSEVPTQVRYRRYLDDDVVIYEDRPAYGYYVPPRYPTYGYAPPPPVFYREPAPIVELLPPPRPSSCGKFRYWNGDYCADARYRPPYVGPRW